MAEKQRATGVPPVEPIHGRDGHATGGIRIRQGAYLPHWTREGGIYFVTFRLADSLPQAVVKAWKAEREDISDARASNAGRLRTQRGIG